MLENAFVGQTTKPSDADVSAALGPAKSTWDRFLAELAQKHGADTQEWKSYSKKSGWALRVLRRKCTIVWLSPAAGEFNVLFILGEKAVRAAREAKLPPRIVAALDVAPKYPEGTGLRLEIKSFGDLGALMKLAAIKVAK